MGEWWQSQNGGNPTEGSVKEAKGRHRLRLGHLPVWGPSKAGLRGWIKRDDVRWYWGLPVVIAGNRKWDRLGQVLMLFGGEWKNILSSVMWLPQGSCSHSWHLREFGHFIATYLIGLLSIDWNNTIKQCFPEVLLTFSTYFNKYLIAPTVKYCNT